MTRPSIDTSPPRRSAIIIVPDGQLERLLTTEASLTLPESTRIIATGYDLARTATIFVITGPDLDEVAPGCELPLLPLTIIEPPR